MQSQLFGLENTEMIINLIGLDYRSNVLPQHKKLHYVRSTPVPTVGEESTLTLVRDYCKGDPSSIVWYFHSKGTRELISKRSTT